MRERIESRLIAAFACLVFVAGCGNSGHSRPPTHDMNHAIVDAGVCGTCPAARPRCDAKTRTCIACVSDSDCGGGMLCRLGSCAPGCSAMHSDCGDAGVCERDGGVCVGCVADTDCKDAKLPYCDRALRHCSTCDPNNDHCQAGFYCGMTAGHLACVAGCKMDTECMNDVDAGVATSACCNHLCVDLDSSATNCGACKMDCGTGSCCTGSCSDTTSDAANCGACGTSCNFPNAAGGCSGGTCSIGSCNSGWGDCDNNVQNGCETDVTNDDNNCGRCGHSCSFFLTCNNGKCSLF